MPSPPPVRNWRRPGVLAAVVLLLVAGVAGYVLLRPSRPPAPARLTGCQEGVPGHSLELTPSQAGIAATIAGVASRQDMPARAVAIAYATALQESKLTNLTYGDLDSVGIFQQRPSQGWGTRQQIEDPVYATSRFFAALVRVPRYQQLPIASAAQAVQHSADGSAYAQYAAVGTQLSDGFTGAFPHQMWCTYAGQPGKPQLTAAATDLAGAFGPVGTTVLASRGHPARSAVALAARQGAQGWAMASWLVAHARKYGITSVRYQGYQWAGFTGPGHWTRQPPPPRPHASPAADPGSGSSGAVAGTPAAVVFG